jgi:hypothetical protein
VPFPIIEENMHQLTKAESAALTRLFAAAEEETPMGHRISRFLLAWWNPAVHGCFDFADATMVSTERRADMVVVFGAALRLGDRPGSFGQRSAFRQLSHTWLGGTPTDRPLFDAEHESLSDL